MCVSARPSDLGFLLPPWNVLGPNSKAGAKERQVMRNTWLCQKHRENAEVLLNVDAFPWSFPPELSTYGCSGAFLRINSVF